MTGRKTYLKDVQPYLENSRADLFNVWLANNRDITKCLLVMKRRQIQRTTTHKGWSYMKKRDIQEKIYGGNA